MPYINAKYMNQAYYASLYCLMARDKPDFVQAKHSRQYIAYFRILSVYNEKATMPLHIILLKG